MHCIGFGVCMCGLCCFGVLVMYVVVLLNANIMADIGCVCAGDLNNVCVTYMCVIGCSLCDCVLV